MTKGLIALAVIGVIVILMAIARTVQKIDGPTARAKVEAGALLIDVRSPGEFASGHIKGAINIPLGVLSDRIGELGPTQTELVLYCQSGMRSGRAVKFLKGKGFEKTHNLGPMSAW